MALALELVTFTTGPTVEVEILASRADFAVSRASVVPRKLPWRSSPTSVRSKGARSS